MGETETRSASEYEGATLIRFTSKGSTMATTRRTPRSSTATMSTGTTTKEEATYTTKSKYY